MAADRPAILVTRPEPGATALVRVLQEQLEAEVFKAPLTAIRPTGARIEPGNATALLFTSPKAAALAGALPDLPAYAVGRLSAEAARARGLGIGSIGPGQVDRAWLESFPRDARVLHLSGADVAVDPEPVFAGCGVAYRRIIVYRAEPVDTPPAELRQFLTHGGRNFVTFLSARAAEIFPEKLRLAAPPTSAPRLAALCLSPRIAAAAKASGVFEKVHSSGTADPLQFVDFVRSRCT